MCLFWSLILSFKTFPLWSLKRMSKVLNRAASLFLGWESRSLGASQQQLTVKPHRISSSTPTTQPSRPAANPHSDFPSLPLCNCLFSDIPVSQIPAASAVSASAVSSQSSKTPLTWAAPPGKVPWKCPRQKGWSMGFTHCFLSKSMVLHCLLFDARKPLPHMLYGFIVPHDGRARTVPATLSG